MLFGEQRTRCKSVASAEHQIQSPSVTDSNAIVRYYYNLELPYSFIYLDSASSFVETTYTSDDVISRPMHVSAISAGLYYSNPIQN